MNTIAQDDPAIFKTIIKLLKMLNGQVKNLIIVLIDIYFSMTSYVLLIIY